ncbi:hypothetical protein GEV43_03835 [Actinomadura sp. J1-007]|uniref:hypothetical protein n=1 Tax=Actinomadura sp. J1-007 TaxID=2661913 RepID=UPI001321065E|nr:hypothetical protein [Actinomadura sp. J1-007]MWK33257.1 hypothetical protein [Actinomadura sp. J1-007]
MRTIADKARDGVTVRILLGNPDGPRISERGADEGVGDSLAAKIRNALVLYEPLRDLDNVEIRLHDTVLYNSIYRADDDLLINPTPTASPHPTPPYSTSAARNPPTWPPPTTTASIESG